MKKMFALTLTFILVLSLLAGCVFGNNAASSNLSVALVVAGTFGDRSFYDSSKAGCDKLAAEGIQVNTIECGNENHTQQIYNAADTADVVILVGWEFYDVETVAPEYPDKRFIWIDNPPEDRSNPIDNVLYITYAQNEGSFLAGYIAAKLSKSGMIGAVGGKDNDTINDFIVGYKQGALYANPHIRVEAVYSNDYDDPAIGRRCALALNENGADVIFQIASKCGSGVFQAAKEKGFYAIGVDSDQKYIDPEVIVCSMCKKVGDSIYDAVKQHMEKGDGCGLWGTTWVADMATGYVGIGYGEEGSIQQVPDDVKAEVEDLARKIVSGEIQVETTR